MKTKFLAAAIMAALFTTAGATAQELKKDAKKEDTGFKKDKKEMMQRIDADNDGKISLAEAEKAPRGRLKENFAAIDTNKDSFLDKEELKAYREEKKKERMSQQN